MSLNPSLNGLYRPLARRAWGVYCARFKLDPGDARAFDTWRRSETWQALGITSTNELDASKPEQFDALMLHFATLANDAGQIGYWTAAPERRALHQLHRSLRNAGVAWSYAEGIARKMGLRLPIETLPAANILKINTAVYLHGRRQQEKGARV